MRNRMLAGVEGALEVDGNDSVELLGAVFIQRVGSQHTGIIYQDIETTECIDRLLDDAACPFKIRDRLIVGNRLAASLGYLGGDLISWPTGFTAA